MSLSKAQQAFHFRPMVARAWEAHCRISPVTDGEKVGEARDRWYREQLQAAVGVASTKLCNPRGDFERLMAHFEELSGDGIQWQLRLAGGSARRLLHNIREECRALDLEEDYVRGLARQALSLDRLPHLDDLTPEQLLMLLKALRKDGARIEEFANAGHSEQEDNEPF